MEEQSVNNYIVLRKVCTYGGDVFDFIAWYIICHKNIKILNLKIINV